MGSLPVAAQTGPKIKSAGFTIPEAVLASTLLAIAIVPILRALTNAQVTSTIVERRTCSLILAQAKLDEIRARSVYDYDEDFQESSTPIDGSYLCTVTDQASGADLRTITVELGYDLDQNNNLENNEVEVTLMTLVVRRL